MSRGSAQAYTRGVIDDPAVAAVERLSAGLADIAPVLEKHGFRLVTRDNGKGSGGYFASAEFAREGRALHLWLRRESLSVRYEIVGHELDHTEYMRELLGPGGGNRFPSYSADAGEAFAALRSDLERFAGDFLAGPGDEYMRCWKAVDEDRGLSRPQRLARIERRLRDS
jgi:hypothetical protein